MRIEPSETIWVLTDSARIARRVEVQPGTTFVSAAERAVFNDRSAALAALAECAPPYPSWHIDAEAMAYAAPIPEPVGGDWRWDEAAGVWRDAQAPMSPVNINAAPAEALQGLTGIGPSLAI
jgi:hypothetical protein